MLINIFPSSAHCYNMSVSVSTYKYNALANLCIWLCSEILSDFSLRNALEELPLKFTFQLYSRTDEFLWEKTFLLLLRWFDYALHFFQFNICHLCGGIKCISSDGHSLKVVHQHNCFQITVWTCLHSHVFSGLTTSNVQSTRNFSLQVCSQMVCQYVYM